MIAARGVVVIAAGVGVIAAGGVVVIAATADFEGEGHEIVGGIVVPGTLVLVSSE